MSYPIDFVVTWVDDSDPEWQAERTKYAPEDNREGNAECRFRDWGLFKYWFRMVEEHAPWVRKVFLVTCGHYPEWINQECEKLVLIRHEDFIPLDYLPTFNSISIELNLWRIEALSEHFVYFNDDMFLTKDVRPTDFFVEGLPKYSAVAIPLKNYGDMAVFQHQLFSNLGIINKHFNVRECMGRHPEKWFSYVYGEDVRYNYLAYKDSFLAGVWFNHLLTPFRKSSFKKVWETINERLDWSCRHRFREPLDLMHQLIQIWEMLEGDFSPVSRNYYGSAPVSGSEEAVRQIIQNTYICVCLNDNERINTEEFKTIKTNYDAIIRGRYPEKSSFEK
jgi:hypothetical protein